MGNNMAMGIKEMEIDWVLSPLFVNY